MDYLIRCIPPQSITDHAKGYDDTIINAAANILGLTPLETANDESPYNTKQKLQLPITHRGWGLISTALKAPIAYLASLALTAAKRPTPAFIDYIRSHQAQSPSDLSPLPSKSRLPNDLSYAIQLTNDNLSERSLIITADSFLPYWCGHPGMSVSLQHTLTVLAHNDIFHAAKSIMLRNPQENKAIIAHMNCITAPHANDWKMVIPTSSALFLTTAQYRLAARLNLGLDTFPSLTLPNACPLCRSEGTISI